MEKLGAAFTYGVGFWLSFWFVYYVVQVIFNLLA